MQTEEVFSDESLIERLDKEGLDWRKIIDNYIEKFNEHRSMQPFTLIEQEESEFKSNFNEFDKLCRILAIAESYNFDKRAKTLQEIHPLAIQVNLQSGVANGVLVVRNAKDCAKLIHQLLTNSMEFTIKHIKHFNLIESEYRTLCSLMKRQLDKKLHYDADKKTLNLKGDLTNKEINYLEKLSKKKSCPEMLKKHLKRFRLEGVTVLEEKISSSPYRVVTNDEKLTNSFWNFYLQSRRKYDRN